MVSREYKSQLSCYTVLVLITSLFLHHARSSLSDLFTNQNVKKDHSNPHTQGSPQPTPNPISSSNSIIRTVATMAIQMSPSPQPQDSNKIIRLKKGLTSYRLITFVRYWTPPWPSIAPASSMKANNAGRQMEPFSVDDILKGSLLPIWVRMAEPQKRKPI